jgi:hypothetical protein
MTNRNVCSQTLASTPGRFNDPTRASGAVFRRIETTRGYIQMLNSFTIYDDRKWE